MACVREGVRKRLFVIRFSRHQTKNGFLSIYLLPFFSFVVVNIAFDHGEKSEVEMLSLFA